MEIDLISVQLPLASGVFVCPRFQFKATYQTSVGENEEGGVENPLERRTISIWPRSFLASSPATTGFEVGIGGEGGANF